MNTSPHLPNAATAPYVENNMSVIQLLDGEEYPVAKSYVIKKIFDRKAAAELCVAYHHRISQFTGCSSYTGDIIT